jgi:ribosomal protein L34
MRMVADESRRRATVGGPARRANSRTGSGVVAEDAARGRSRLSAAVTGVASCTPNRGAHAQHCPAQIPAAKKEQVLCAHVP